MQGKLKDLKAILTNPNILTKIDDRPLSQQLRELKPSDRLIGKSFITSLKLKDKTRSR